MSFTSRSSALPRVSRTDLLLVASVLVWGVNFVFLKVALDALPTSVVNALRFTVSAAVLGGIYVARTPRGEYLDPLRAAPRRLLVLGLMGSFVFPVSFLAVIDETTAGNAALIAASAPLWTALVGRYVGV
ncbi:EamA family transporter, partial [Halobium palmae]